jgi:lipid A ethanolaminephosphotransferase
MFAPVGRRDYDETRIRGSESLLHVAARAGVAVHWRDNQSGCKGVCAGLSNDMVGPSVAPGLCQGDRCWDEGLLRGLDERLQAMRGTHATQLLVLHMLGNHGPSYFRRYPKAFERFTPACQSDDLSRCSRDEIVNAYDNALLYTDHVLASLIGTLNANAAQVDAALVFVSDHGESLGEKNLFLHGVPYAIAPREQTQVPMVMWWTEGFGRATALGADCLRARARQPAQHDHLFHTLLGLLDVTTRLYAPELDLTQGCRNAAHGAG